MSADHTHVQICTLPDGRIYARCPQCGEIVRDTTREGELKTHVCPNCGHVSILFKPEYPEDAPASWRYEWAHDIIKGGQ